MKRKHVPIRTCVGCRQSKPKKELIRVVRTPQLEIAIDHTGKKSGRGAYLCPSRCLSKALQGRQLERALQTTISEKSKLCWSRILMDRVFSLLGLHSAQEKSLPVPKGYVLYCGKSKRSV